MDHDVLQNLMKRFPCKAFTNADGEPTGIVRVLARAAFPYLVKPREGKDDVDDFPNDDSGKKGTREITLLFPKGYDLTPFNKILEAAAVKEHGDKVMAMVKAEAIKWPVKDQGKRMNTATGELWEGMEAGAKLCTAKTNNLPDIRDRGMKHIDASAIYPGCWCLFTLHGYAGIFNDKKTKAKIKYIAVGLNNIQFVADDDRLGGGGGTRADDEFEPIDGIAPTGFEGKGAPAAKDEYDFG
jgi:hypothetical protein